MHVCVVDVWCAYQYRASLVLYPKVCIPVVPDVTVKPRIWKLLAVECSTSPTTSNQPTTLSYLW